MLHLFQLNSKEIQSYIYICVFFFKFFSHLGYYRILSRLPCAIDFQQISLLAIYFKYSSVYLSILNFQSIIFPHTSPPVAYSCKFVLQICESVSVI